MSTCTNNQRPRRAGGGSQRGRAPVASAKTPYMSFELCMVIACFSVGSILAYFMHSESIGILTLITHMHFPSLFLVYACEDKIPMCELLLQMPIYAPGLVSEIGDRVRCVPGLSQKISPDLFKANYANMNCHMSVSKLTCSVLPTLWQEFRPDLFRQGARKRRFAHRSVSEIEDLLDVAQALEGISADLFPVNCNANAGYTTDLCKKFKTWSMCRGSGEFRSDLFGELQRKRIFPQVCVKSKTARCVPSCGRVPLIYFR